MCLRSKVGIFFFTFSPSHYFTSLQPQEKVLLGLLWSWRQTGGRNAASMHLGEVWSSPHCPGILEALWRAGGPTPLPCAPVWTSLCREQCYWVQFGIAVLYINWIFKYLSAGHVMLLLCVLTMSIGCCVFWKVKCFFKSKTFHTYRMQDNFF